MKILLILLLVVTSALTACTLTPGVDIGVDFDYYGGKFHVRPNASIGLHGRP